MMVLALGAFWLWHRLHAATDAGSGGRLPVGWLWGLGAACGLLFLAEYSAGTLTLVALVYTGIRFQGRGRMTAQALVAFGFLLLAGPWMGRNLAPTTSPVGLAAQNLALKFGDPTAEPTLVRSTLSADFLRLDLKKLGNKTLTSLQENLR
ncbi:MAG: hypothetical protein EXS38_10605 [Opitutus sp.]|nr:hypothetical protein [Opitutus sp.]